MKKEKLLAKLDKKTFYKTLVPSLKANGEAEAKGLCPFHDDKNPSLSVNFDSGLFNCFSCGNGGDVFTFYQRIKGVGFKIALKEIAMMQGMIDVKPRVVARFEYKDKEGKTPYTKERVEPGRDGKDKEFFFKHQANGKGVNGRGCKPVLYNLPEIVNNKRFIFVEGEGKAELLRKWGLAATCLDSGAKSQWQDEYLKHIEGKEEVTILPDNDKPGRSYASMIANALHGKVEMIKIVGLPGLKEKEDVINWAKIPGNDKKKLLDIIVAAPVFDGEAMEENKDEEAFIRQDSDLIPETPFPLEIFPGELSEFIHRLAESLHVPVNLSACCTLPIIGSAVGNTLRISPKPGWLEPPFIWLVPIAFSGDGKSPVIDKLMEPLHKLQLDAYEKYSEELKMYEKALRRAKKEQDVDVPDRPKMKHYKVTDFTTEVLVDIFHDDPHGILIYRDELSGLFLGLNQYKGGKGNDRQQLLELFNCAPMKVDRKNKVTCTARSGASIIGGLQPRVMLEIFQEASFDDGLAPRFLFVHIDSMRKRFSRTSITDADSEYWSQLLNWCYGLQRYYGGSQQAAILRLNSDALDVFEGFYNNYEDLTPFLSSKAKVFIPKLITYSLRLAGVLHTIQAHPRIDKFDKPISAETITNAIKLTHFFAGQMAKGLKLYEKKEPVFDEYTKRLVEKLRKLRFTVRHGKIKLEQIVEEFNKNLPEALQYTPERMTKLLTTLGLKTQKSTGNRSYLIWEQEKLVKIFSRIPVPSVPTVTKRSVEPVKQGTEVTEGTVVSKENNLAEVEI